MHLFYLLAMRLFLLLLLVLPKTSQTSLTYYCSVMSLYLFSSSYSAKMYFVTFLLGKRKFYTYISSIIKLECHNSGQNLHHFTIILVIPRKCAVHSYLTQRDFERLISETKC